MSSLGTSSFFLKCRLSANEDSLATDKDVIAKISLSSSKRFLIKKARGHWNGAVYQERDEFLNF